MKYLRFILIGLVMVGLVLGILLNNLWRLMPEFHHLDMILTVPLSIQVILLLISMTLGVFLFRTKLDRRILAGFVFSLLLSMASWYQVVLSNSVNSLSVGVQPFYQTQIKYSDISRVKIDDNKIIVTTMSKSYPIFTGLYPLGVDRQLLLKSLMGYGTCLNKVADQCVDLEFAWP